MPIPSPTSAEFDLLYANKASMEAAYREAIATSNAFEIDNQKLKRQLSKDSSNSSKPSSTDFPFAKKARKPAPAGQLAGSKQPEKKKRGGQRGHPGVTLHQVKDPDTTINCPLPDLCPCGRELESESTEIRQVTDIPSVSMFVTSYEGHSATCACGRVHKSVFPPGVNAPVQYGDTIIATVAYLSDHHMLPVARIAELMQALYGQSMSTGTIMALKAKAAQLLSVPYDQIKQALLGSTVTHADETGLKVNGKLAWLHALATPALTFVAVQARRGREAIDAIGAIAKLGGTLVCDGWSPYKSYPNVNLAQCGAHILRELNAIYQEGNQEWAAHMHNFLVETVHEANQAKGEALTPARIAELRLAYDAIGASGFETNLPALPAAGTKRVPAQTAAYNMLSRLRREADDILRFTTNPAVPFTNNVAERTMRMIKVKQKVSGGFRTWEGAQNFSIVRSCVDTMRKQGASILEVLKGLFQIARAVGDLQPASV